MPKLIQRKHSRRDAIRDALDLLQPEGEGWNTFQMACCWALRRAAVGYDEAIELLTARADELGISNARISEVIDAADQVYEYDEDGSHTHRATGLFSKKIPADLNEIERVINTGITADELAAMSKEQNPAGVSTWSIIKRLFPDRESLICIGKDVFDSRVLRRDEEVNPQSWPFIVPSPMTTRSGYNLSGKITPRCLSNTGARRFLTIEFDFAKYSRDGATASIYYPLIERLGRSGRNVQDMCAALLWNLATQPAAPGELAMVVYSGGKSLHGWFYVNGKTDQEITPFFTQALQLGADPQTWVRCQLVRMPNGTRAEPPYKKQTVVYLNFNYA